MTFTPPLKEKNMAVVVGTSKSTSSSNIPPPALPPFEMTISYKLTTDINEFIENPEIESYVSYRIPEGSWHDLQIIKYFIRLNKIGSILDSDDDSTSDKQPPASRKRIDEITELMTEVYTLEYKIRQIYTQLGLDRCIEFQEVGVSIHRIEFRYIQTCIRQRIPVMSEFDEFKLDIYHAMIDKLTDTIECCYAGHMFNGGEGGGIYKLSMLFKPDYQFTISTMVA